VLRGSRGVLLADHDMQEVFLLPALVDSHVAGAGIKVLEAGARSRPGLAESSKASAIERRKNEEVSMGCYVGGF